MSKPHEIVLPDGRYCNVRRMTVGDLIASSDTNTFRFMANIASHIATIDGKPVKVESIIADDYENWRPVFKLIGDQLDRAHQLQDGVA